MVTSLHDLESKALKHHVERANGAGQSVVYIDAKTKTQTTLNCYPQDALDSEVEKNTSRDYCVFNTLFLPTPPLTGDVIKWNNKVWRFNTLKPNTDTAPYDVIMDSAKHIISGSRR